MLKSQTLFDINLVVEDLPIGQLAEAQIIKYDPQGRPIGGTLLIDTDANGKGWFVYPTHLYNSEFTTTFSDTAYSAETNSPAWDRYSLLTAILHELAYIAGFIDGYSGGSGKSDLAAAASRADCRTFPDYPRTSTRNTRD